MIFGPDLDVTGGETDAAIGIRSLSGDPAQVGELGTAMARGYRDAGILAVAKHFPGHGSLMVDSHVELPETNTNRDGLTARDLRPFQGAIDAAAPAVMVGHIAVNTIDKGRPATVSRAITTELLRGSMRFSGLIITDSMRMGAITQRFDSAHAAVAAISAGADVVLMPADALAARDGIVDAVQRGQISRARLEESAARLVASLRYNVGNMPDEARVGSHRGIADELAGRSIVQLGGRCGAPLVEGPVTVTGTPGAVDDFTRAATAQGMAIEAAGKTRVALIGGPGNDWFAGVKHAAEATPMNADIVIATDSPWYLPRTHATKARLATFGRSPATWDAIISVLLGKLTARGVLPVSLDQFPAGSGCR